MEWGYNNHSQHNEHNTHNTHNGHNGHNGHNAHTGHNEADCRLEECGRYVRENRVLWRALEGFRGKYASFGTAAGRVFLKDLSHTDIEVLEGFFQKSFHGKKHVALSASEFQKALDKSRFTGIVLDQLLAYCYGAGLKSNKAMRQETYSARMDMFRRIAEEMPGTPGAGWIMRISTERMPVTQMITRHYRTDQEGIHKLLRYTARALNHLPAGLGKVEYLAVFSARITGDPHYFDEGNEANTLLRHGLESLMGAGAAGPGSHTFPAFQKQELLLKAGILKDDLSNHTVACGIHAWKKDGSPHEGVEGFWRCRESMYLTLATVAGLGRVSCEGGVIYIFENPSVYSVLTAGQEGRKSFLCMNGQPHMAAILLMDGLAAAGTVMYYAGDFDPEGLWIAQRLKLRYGANLCFLGMDREHYRRVMSPVPVDARRLKVLDRITDGELREVARCIRESGRAGYQEGLIGDYAEMINSMK